MSERELKKLLSKALTREEELLEFCEECLHKIYGEEARRLIYMFHEGIMNFEYNGSIQSLEALHNDHKRQKNHAYEMKKQREQENANT